MIASTPHTTRHALDSTAGHVGPLLRWVLGVLDALGFRYPLLTRTDIHHACCAGDAAELAPGAAQSSDWAVIRAHMCMSGCTSACLLPVRALAAFLSCWTRFLTFVWPPLLLCGDLFALLQLH